MKLRIILPAMLLAATPAFGQAPPGENGSRNVKVISHLPLGRLFSTTDIEIEQELSRPYVYVTRRFEESGFDLLNIKDPARPQILLRWRLENPALHQGTGALAPAYVKINGRYFFIQSYQYASGGPDYDLGASVFDVTGLPDTTKVKEVGRIRAPDTPGGFHEIYAYKHSDGRALIFATTTGAHANVYDIGRFASNPAQGLVAQIPIPDSLAAGAIAGGRVATYHDFYVGYDPATRQDKFYGAGSGGYYVFDITQLGQPKLITTITGMAGITRGHTFTPDPTGRYAVLETEYQFAPLRMVDLKPGLDGTVKTISRPIGAWTANWKNLVHNHEVRWPYVFTSAYEDGLQIFNMMDPTNPYTVGYYDTFEGPHMSRAPYDRYAADSVGRGGVNNGAFGIDVRNADGLIVISDMSTGFWSFKMEGFDGWNGHQWGMPNISSAQDWDNGPDGAPKPQRVSLVP